MRQNKDVSRCNSVVVVCRVVWCSVDNFVSVDDLGDGVVDGWEMSERLRGLYPMENADFVIEF